MENKFINESGLLKLIQLIKDYIDKKHLNDVTGVKGNNEANYRTGNVNITKSNIGLSEVDNTSDVNKPISNATQLALDLLVVDIDSKSFDKDPTVPDWVKSPTKPEYTASEVGALPDDTEIPSTEGLASEAFVAEEIAKINIPSLDGYATIEDITNNCPTIEDTRNGNVNKITGKAPFETLEDGQRIILHVIYPTEVNSTLNLTLSNGTLTGEKYIKYQVPNTVLPLPISEQYGRYMPNRYIEMVYDSAKNHWICLTAVNAVNKFKTINNESILGEGNITALQSFTETDPVFSASAAAGITSSDITNWNSKTDNVGTITGINMNGSSKGTSGVVDLGTVITSETPLSIDSRVVGNGNAITNISVNGHVISLTKDSTFLTQHQSLTSLADGIWYDSTNKRIYLKNGNSNLTGTYSYIDATDFIKDGMVSNVTVDTPSSGPNNGVLCLIITFNTDAGTDDIELPISNIFDANNYYNKTDVDNALANYVTLATAQNITGEKTFVGQKKIKFKLSAASDKLGFTLFDNNNKELAYLEYNGGDLCLGSYYQLANQHVKSRAGFKLSDVSSGVNAVYRILTPRAGDAKVPFSLTNSIKDFYFTLGISDGTNQILTASNGLLDISLFFANYYNKTEVDTSLSNKIRFGKINNNNFYAADWISDEWALPVNAQAETPDKERLYVDVFSKQLYYYNDGNYVTSELTDSDFNEICV